MVGVAAGNEGLHWKRYSWEGRVTAWFGAFDAPWKPEAVPGTEAALRAVEPHVCLFDAAGKAKRAVVGGRRLDPPGAGAGPQAFPPPG